MTQTKVCLYDRVPYSDKWHKQKCACMTGYLTRINGTHKSVLV